MTGKGKIIRQFPMVPGIDFAGRVSESRDPRFVPGQAVILTGWAWAKTTGAVWPQRPVSKATGWLPCRRHSARARR
ncbi:hypothetical protein [Klebsiella quasipneumoniae]|uniref:hypothetical protein n=1 Tax=Klebsiella quasipneumoniae TaxID=1463165 RepID=UPI003715EFEF